MFSILGRSTSCLYCSSLSQESILMIRVKQYAYRSSACSTYTEFIFSSARQRSSSRYRSTSSSAISPHCPRRMKCILTSHIVRLTFPHPSRMVTQSATDTSRMVASRYPAQVRLVLLRRRSLLSPTDEPVVRRWQVQSCHRSCSFILAMPAVVRRRRRARCLSSPREKRMRYFERLQAASLIGSRVSFAASFYFSITYQRSPAGVRKVRSLGVAIVYLHTHHEP